MGKNGETSTFLIRPDDRVVFWGDSITEDSRYCRTIEHYVRGRYPHYKADFYNLGWGGDRAVTGPRMLRDLVPLSPTLVLVKLGMNDGQYRPFTQSILDEYLGGIADLVSIIRTRTAARIVLITPNQYETGSRNRAQDGELLDRVYQDTLRRLSDGLLAYGARESIPVIDLNREYQSAIEDYKRRTPALLFSDDGIHPGAAGHALIAFMILTGLGADGAILELAVDASTGSVMQALHQDVRVASAPDGVTIERRLEALPFLPSDHRAIDVDLSPWFDRLNRNVLRVTGLTAPWYRLIIDGEAHALAVFSREELAAGVNLSSRGLELPESDMASLVMRLTLEKHQARFERWRRHLLRGAASSYDPCPYRDETVHTRFLSAKAESVAAFVTGPEFQLPAYRMRLIAATSTELFPGAPFTVQKPYPARDEVQILFTVDTNPWKDLVTADGKLTSFTPPLRFKTASVDDWKEIPMFDDGTHGDERAGDGIYSIAVNVPRRESACQFAFDDASEPRGANESVAMEIIKAGLGRLPGLGLNEHPAFTPDSIKRVEITAEHFASAVRRGLIKTA